VEIELIYSPLFTLQVNSGEHLHYSWVEPHWPRPKWLGLVGSGRVWPSPKKKEEENISWVELAYLLSNLFWTDFSPAMMGSSQYI
jgi:hypothetical protein